MTATLYVIPSPIADNGHWQMNEDIKGCLLRSKVVVCERIRTTRRWIRSIFSQEAFDQLEFIEIDKHEPETYLSDVKPHFERGAYVAMLSEAGMPGIADPGMHLMRLAHDMNIHVRPLVGPCSFMMALSASGLNGQKFRFHGYLSRKDQIRRNQIIDMQRDLQRTGASQIFMETPYRNHIIYEDIRNHVSDKLYLHISAHLDHPDAFIRTMPIHDWPKKLDIFSEKVTAVFILGKT